MKKAIKFIKSIFRNNEKTTQKQNEKNAMHPARDIIKAVETYIETPDTRYAIMIDGDWGCGKTYLWQNTLLPIIGESEAIYISLFGLKDIKDIENEIFRSISMVGTDEEGILRGILNSNPEIAEDIKVGGLGFAVQFGLKKWRENRIKKGKSLFISFDDLERWAGDLDICLSYINKLVEHEGTKCLIIGNEKELNKENKESFNKYKEKTIKFKYILSYPPLVILESAISIANFPSKESKEYIENLLVNNSIKIFDLLDSARCYNIRTLSTAIYYLSLIYSHNKEKFEPSPASAITYFISLLSTLILFEHYKDSNEVKDLILDQSGKDEIELRQQLQVYYFDRNENEEAQTDEKKIIETLMQNTFDQTDEIKHQGKFSIINYGFYRDEDFENEFSEWKPTEDYEYYMDTLKFYYLNDNEAKSIFESTKKAMFIDKSITHPSILLLLTDRIMNDIKRGVVNLDFEETKSNIRSLFNELYQENRMNIVKHIDLRYGFRRFEYCEDIYSEIIERNNIYIESVEKHERTEFWSKLKKKPHELDDLVAEYEEFEIFAMYKKPDEIIDTIETLDNGQLFEFTRDLGSRIGNPNCLKAVENEDERAQVIAEILENKYGNQFGVRAGHMKQIARILRNKRTDYDFEYIDRMKQEKDNKAKNNTKNGE